MQLDMHYHGTYAMARAAGIASSAAEVIATCAQFVDDNVARTTLKFDSGARVDSVATAHHAVDTENLRLMDQRQVWVPFHFLPGNDGDDFTERLKCRIDSVVARQMVDHHVGFADKPYALALMGVAAHVYADTFSHYGFSGISSRGNRVVNHSFRFADLDSEIEEYIRDKEAAFRQTEGAQLHPNFRDEVRREDGWHEGEGCWASLINTVTSYVAETASGALGHGSVATFPDRPYLVWEFDYENRDDKVLGRGNPANPRHSARKNPETFLAGCQALHSMFDRFRRARPSIDAGGFRSFTAIRDVVSDVLKTQAKKDGRIKAWQSVAAAGTVFGAGKEEIPDYKGLLWNDEWENFDGGTDASALRDRPVWHFYQAAALHRTYVLRDLLPAHDLIVD